MLVMHPPCLRTSLGCWQLNDSRCDLAGCDGAASTSCTFWAKSQQRGQLRSRPANLAASSTRQGRRRRRRGLWDAGSDAEPREDASTAATWLHLISASPAPCCGLAYVPGANVMLVITASSFSQFKHAQWSQQSALAPQALLLVKVIWTLQGEQRPAQERDRCHSCQK